MVKEIINNLNQMKKYDKKYNKLYNKYIIQLDYLRIVNYHTEDKLNLLYRKSYKCFTKAVELLYYYFDEKIDEITIRSMIINNPDEIIRILNVDK